MEDPAIKIARLLENTDWTEEDKQWLLDHLHHHGDRDLRNLLKDSFYEDLEKNRFLDPQVSAEILENIHREIKADRKAKHRLFPYSKLRLLTAACVAGILATAVYFWFQGSQPAKTNTGTLAVTAPQKVIINDVEPGTDKAVLTLGDGSTILLDDSLNGSLTTQGNTQVLKSSTGITYDAAKAGDQAEILYNTVSTPRGGQYHIMLPDGSQVWLNAASSLHFPTVFTGKERRVNVTGEAYFEIAHNESMPFIVQVKNAEVQVLGTHFNVMAYDEESLLKTTLLEGSVQFRTAGRTGRLKPGEQSQLDKHGALKITQVENLSEVTAWKNGMFVFEDADIETVMRQLSRWYDVDVAYRSKKTSEKFIAEIPRSTKLSDALKALEFTGKIDFDIEDKQIVVK